MARHKRHSPSSTGAKEGPIAEQFHADHNARTEGLERVQLVAALSKPWVLTPTDQQKNAKLPEPYQSLCARGFTNLTGRMLMALFPPGQPWLEMEPAPEILFAAGEADPIIQEIQTALFLHTVQIQATLESAAIRDSGRRRSGFRSQMRSALDQILITGETTLHENDDYSLTVFRRDQYVNRRDSSGAILYQIVAEELDPLALSDDILGRAMLDKEDLRAKPVGDRLQRIHTRIEWQPWAQTWLITQEMNGKTVVESEERENPYINVASEVPPGMDYARGFGELNLGDMRSYNELSEKLLDFAALASKHLLCKDYSSEVSDRDLQKPTGSVIRARVSAGGVQDIAFLRADKVHDFRVAFETAMAKGKDLGQAMLLDSVVQPTGERVTATQVRRIAAELEGSLGGIYAPISESLQMSLARRTIYQMQRDKLMPVLDPKHVRINLLTGISAVGRELQLSRLSSFVDIISKLGPQAMKWMNQDVLIQVLQRYFVVTERGLLKSPQQMEQERQAEAQQQVAQQAQQQMVQSAGTIAESAMAA